MENRTVGIKAPESVRRVYKAAAADLGITIMALLARLTSHDNAREIAALQAAARRMEG